MGFATDVFFSALIDNWLKKETNHLQLCININFTNNSY